MCYTYKDVEKINGRHSKGAITILHNVKSMMAVIKITLTHMGAAKLSVHLRQAQSKHQWLKVQKKELSLKLTSPANVFNKTTLIKPFFY